MVDVPSIDEIERIARAAGLQLNPDEAQAVQGTIAS
jgi:hypothetical protein